VKKEEESSAMVSNIYQKNIDTNNMGKKKVRQPKGAGLSRKNEIDN